MRLRAISRVFFGESIDFGLSFHATFRFEPEVTNGVIVARQTPWKEGSWRDSKGHTAGASQTKILEEHEEWCAILSGAPRQPPQFNAEGGSRSANQPSGRLPERRFNEQLRSAVTSLAIGYLSLHSLALGKDDSSKQDRSSPNVNRTQGDLRGS